MLKLLIERTLNFEPGHSMYAPSADIVGFVQPTQITDRLAIGFYLAYAALAITLVLWLSRTLSRHGKVFLDNVFDSDELAGAVNHLLVVGFLLLNLGYALTLYKVQASVGLSDAYNTLIARLGALLASLGVIHLLNMAVFWKIRHSRNSGATAPTFPAPYNYVPPVAAGPNNPTPEAQVPQTTEAPQAPASNLQLPTAPLPPTPTAIPPMTTGFIPPPPRR